MHNHQVIFMQVESTKNQLSDIQELTSLFDLLARFDFEDRQKSEININEHASAPCSLILASENNQITQ